MIQNQNAGLRKPVLILYFTISPEVFSLKAKFTRTCQVYKFLKRVASIWTVTRLWIITSQWIWSSNFCSFFCGVHFGGVFHSTCLYRSPSPWSTRRYLPLDSMKILVFLSWRALLLKQQSAYFEHPSTFKGSSLICLCSSRFRIPHNHFVV